MKDELVRITVSIRAVELVTVVKCKLMFIVEVHVATPATTNGKRERTWNA